MLLPQGGLFGYPHPPLRVGGVSFDVQEGLRSS